MLLSVLLLFSFALHSRADTKCFIQDEGKEDLYHIVRQDCIEVAKLMIHGDKAHAPMTFSRKEGVGFQVPHEWALKGTCLIAINVVAEDDEVVFSVAKMAHTVATIIHECVDNPDFDKLGGKDECGPKQKIIVVVAGKPVDAMESSMNITLAQFSTSSGSLMSTPNVQDSGSLTSRRGGKYITRT